MYSSEQSKTCNETGGSGEKLTYHIQDMHMHISVAREFWSFDASLCDLERCYLSPWNVLQCYLESTLQVFLPLSVHTFNLKIQDWTYLL